MTTTDEQAYKRACGAVPILRYFSYTHLPAHLQVVSEKFYHLAMDIDNLLPMGAEKAVALRKLLESKDAAVRAALDATERRPISKERRANGC